MTFTFTSSPACTTCAGVSMWRADHVNHPSEVVKVGDEVEVEVLDVDLQRERISLGLKQTTPDPWIKLQDKTALDHFDDLAGDHFAGLELLLDGNPGTLVLGALLGEDETA